MHKSFKTSILVVSDVHIGSPVSRSRTLRRTLKRWDFEVLVINGDLFNDLKSARLSHDDWKLLLYLQWLAARKKVLWVKGNHDDPVAQVLTLLLGIELVDEHRFELERVKYLIIHGHQFDHFILENPTVTDIACAIYYTLHIIDGRKQRLSRLVKRISKKWLRLSKEVATKALAYGVKQGVDVIVCGHTHKAATQEDGKVRYYNSGCLTDIPSTVLSIDKRVRIWSVDEDEKCMERGDHDKH